MERGKRGYKKLRILSTGKGISGRAQGFEKLRSIGSAEEALPVSKFKRTSRIPCAFSSTSTPLLLSALSHFNYCSPTSTRCSNFRQCSFSPLLTRTSSQQPNVLALALSPLSSSSLYSKMSTSRDHTCNTLELTTPLNPLGKPILVPLTTSLYVPGELADTENVIVDIGTGFYVEKVRLLFSSIILYLPFITPLYFSNSILYIHFFIPILEITCILNSLETYIQTLEHQRCNQILRSKS